jgi:ribosome maturation factor RimP
MRGGGYSLFCCFIFLYMESVTRIQELLEAHLENGHFFVVDVNISRSKRNPTLTILLDTDEGISIDECAKISRLLSDEIEAEELFDTPFVMEVSSPGVDTPLVNQRQYTKNIGRSLKINLIEGEKIIGKLLSVTDTNIEILEEVLRGKLKSVKKEPTFINFNKIKSAQVQVSFS